jgi:hypothetical protein
VVKSDSLPSWANNSSPIDYPHITALQDVLTVELIATKRAEFVTCTEDELLANVVQRTRSKQFDFLPVVEAGTATAADSGKIIGLVEIRHYLEAAANQGNVGEAMQRLSDENLIGANASILAFVRDADRQRCRLVVSGQKISGLVSLSDLQKLPVRATLFGLITDLEITMTEMIRREFNNSVEWLRRLPSSRQEKLNAEMAKSNTHDGLVDQLLFTQFCDKVMIIKKSPQFATDRSDFEHDMKEVQKLRDRVAHANDYAATPDAAVTVCGTVRLIEKWSKELALRHALRHAA